MSEAGDSIARLARPILRTCVRGMVLAATAVAGLPLLVVSLACVLLLPAGMGVALALMAEGHSNAGIAGRLVVTEKAVSKHIGGIFTKLDLYPAAAGNRRVLAVLTYLNA